MPRQRPPQGPLGPRPGARAHGSDNRAPAAGCAGATTMTIRAASRKAASIAGKRIGFLRVCGAEGLPLQVVGGAILHTRQMGERWFGRAPKTASEPLSPSGWNGQGDTERQDDDCRAGHLAGGEHAFSRLRQGEVRLTSRAKASVLDSITLHQSRRYQGPTRSTIIASPSLWTWT
jgi:hypothetical protein